MLKSKNKYTSYIYIYIYIERERERERKRVIFGYIGAVILVLVMFFGSEEFKIR